MKQFRLLISFSFFLLFSLSLYALDLSDLQLRSGCAAALTEVNAEARFSPSAIMRANVQIPTVKISARKKGPHGGKLITLEKIYQHWGSDHYKESHFAPQGDPRGFLATVDEETAKFFGFEFIDWEHLVVPSVEEFSLAIEKANKLLRKNKSPYSIPIQFEKTPKTKFPLTHYLTTFSKRGVLPFAIELSHFLHDVSQHTASIFYPEELAKRSRYLTGNVLSLTRHLKREFGADDPDAKAAHLLRRMLLHTRTRQIDEGTGTFVFELQDFLNKSAHVTIGATQPNATNTAFALPFLLLSGGYPDEAKRDYSYDMRESSSGFVREWRTDTAQKGIHRMLKRFDSPDNNTYQFFPSMDYSELALVRNFLKGSRFKTVLNQWETQQLRSPKFTEQPKSSFKELCHEISERRWHVMKAVHEFNRAQSPVPKTERR